MSPTIIFLNGVSSSGKTSIARILQRTLPEPYFQVSIDAFEEMLPDRYDDGPAFEWPVIFPKMLSGFHHSIAALATAGNNLIVDHVTVYREGWSSSLLECAYLFTPFRSYLIGVQCPLPELERREQVRGDRFIGTAARQIERVHWYNTYDLEVDTFEASPEACAARIIDFITPNEPSAFAKLRAR